MRLILLALLVVAAVATRPAMAGETCDHGHEIFASGDYPAAMVALTTCLVTLDMDDSERARVFTERGNAFYRTGNYAQALDDYEATLALTPEDSAAYVRRASTREALGDVRGALEDFATALRLDPDNAVAYYDRSYLWGNLVQPDLEAARADLEHAVALVPDDSMYRNNLGFALRRLGDYEGAIEQLDEAIRLDPSNVYAWSNRGKARFWLMQYGSALDDLTRCIEIDPGDVDCYRYRAETYSQLGRAERALADIETAADRAPGDVEVLRVRALINLRRADYDLAQADYDAIMASPWASCCMAAKIARDLLYAAGLPEVALAYARYAAKGEPDDPYDRFLLGNVQAALGHEAEAMEAYAAAAAIGGEPLVAMLRGFATDAGFYQGAAEGPYDQALRDALGACARAKCVLAFAEVSHERDPEKGEADADSNPDCRQGQDYMQVRRYDAAAESYTACIETGGLTGKPLGYAYYLRSAAYRWNMAPQLALKDLDRAVELAPDEPIVRRDRATVRAMVGDLAGAVDDLTAALAATPDDVDMLVERSGDLRALGRTEEALADAERAAAAEQTGTTAHYRRAVLLIDLGRYDEAKAALDDLIAGDPQAAWPYGARAWVHYMTRDDLQAGLEDIAIASSLLPNPDWSMLDVQGHLLAAMGREQEAVDTFEQLIAMVGPALLVEYEKGLVQAGYLPAVGDGSYDAATREALRACVHDGCSMWVQRRF